MIIQTDNLTKKFKSTEAVSLLNLTVEEGSIYGFLGPNGAGKTTTIRLLLGLIAPSGGEVLLFGQRLQRGKRQLLRNIGSLVETPSLYPHLTGKENLQVVTTLLHLPQERIGQMLQLVDFAQDAHRKVSEYSLGMKQRLGIALAPSISPGCSSCMNPPIPIHPEALLYQAHLDIITTPSYQRSKGCLVERLHRGRMLSTKEGGNSSGV